MKKFKLFFLISLCFSVCLLLTIPLSVAWKILPSPSHIMINDVSGGLFKAHVGKMNIKDLTLNNVEYDIRFSDIVTGTVGADIKIKDVNFLVDGLLYHNFSQLGLKSTTIDVRLPWLTQQFSVPYVSELNGNLQVDIIHFQQGVPYCNVLQGKANLYDLNVETPFAPLPLGDIPLEMACKEGNIAIKFDGKNDLQLSGEVMMVGPNQFDVNLKFKLHKKIPPFVANSLGFIAKKSSDGFYNIVYKSK